MTQAYGSDNESAEKVAILDLTPDERLVQSPPSRTKRVASGVVVALAVIGALVAFQSASTNHARTAAKTVKPQPLTLAQTKVQLSQAAYPTDNRVLTSGQEFMIICAKDGKCVDDGGASTSGSTTLYLVACDSNNKNQRFVYDSATNAIRNPSKSNLCWNDDGSRNSGFRLKTCDANNNDSKFVYDWTNRVIKIPTKSGECVDGGATFDHRTCDPTRVNQQFEFVPSAYW